MTLNLGIGKVPVTFDPEAARGGIVWMRAPLPEFGPTHSAESVAPMLRISPGDIHPGFPVQEISVGLPFVFVPVKNLEILGRSRLDPDRLPGFLPHPEFGTLVFVFCPETRDPANQFSARMFFEADGVREDPATGSANTCFAAYLLRHEYASGAPVDVRVEQGYEMERPSLLHLKAHEQDGGPEILVGGRVVLVARGELE
jgi:trans-2,3-dihydro-3-hydroxyanthranilate isomerase